MKNITPISLQKSSPFSDKLPMPQTPLEEMLQAKSKGKDSSKVACNQAEGWEGRGSHGHYLQSLPLSRLAGRSCPSGRAIALAGGEGSLPWHLSHHPLKGCWLEWLRHCFKGFIHRKGGSAWVGVCNPYSCMLGFPEMTDGWPLGNCLAPYSQGKIFPIQTLLNIPSVHPQVE